MGPYRHRSCGRAAKKFVLTVAWINLLFVLTVAWINLLFVLTVARINLLFVLTVAWINLLFVDVVYKLEFSRSGLKYLTG